MLQQEMFQEPEPPRRRGRVGKLLVILLITSSLIYLVIHYGFLNNFLNWISTILSIPQSNTLAAMLSLIVTIIGVIISYKALDKDRKPKSTSFQLRADQRNFNGLRALFREIINVFQQFLHKTPSPIPDNQDDPRRFFIVNKQKLPHPNDFFGRNREFEELLKEIRSATSTAIIGPSWIGKSWMIQLLDLTERSNFPSGFRFAYLDATSPSCQTTAKFTEEALRKLGYGGHITNASNLTLEALDYVIRDLYTKHIIPVLCIDGFDCFEGTTFNNSFYGHIGYLCEKQGLVLVIASQKLPREINDRLQFFGRIIRLEGFTENEARNFILEKSAQAGFSAEEQECLLECGLETDRDGQKRWPPIRLQRGGKMLLEDKESFERDNIYNYKPGDSLYRQEFIRRLDERHQ
jgi:hypothetical protein